MCFIYSRTAGTASSEWTVFSASYWQCYMSLSTMVSTILLGNALVIFQTAYRHWLCGMTMPYYWEKKPIKPCNYSEYLLSFCDSVEKKCPYFLPQLDSQYAGEPSFLCTGTSIKPLFSYFCFKNRIFPGSQIFFFVFSLHIAHVRGSLVVHVFLWIC